MIKKLRNCNALVYHGIDAKFITSITKGDTTINFNDGDYKYIYVLKSYNSIVAILDLSGPHDMLYLLPRNDYSVTTKRQICKFIEDYYTKFYSVKWRDIMSYLVSDPYGQSLYAEKVEYFNNGKKY